MKYPGFSKRQQHVYDMDQVIYVPDYDLLRQQQEAEQLALIQDAYVIDEIGEEEAAYRTQQIKRKQQLRSQRDFSLDPRDVFSTVYRAATQVDDYYPEQDQSIVTEERFGGGRKNQRMQQIQFEELQDFRPDRSGFPVQQDSWQSQIGAYEVGAQFALGDFEVDSDLYGESMKSNSRRASVQHRPGTISFQARNQRDQRLLLNVAQDEENFQSLSYSRVPQPNYSLYEPPLQSHSQRQSGIDSFNRNQYVSEPSSYDRGNGNISVEHRGYGPGGAPVVPPSRAASPKGQKNPEFHKAKFWGKGRAWNKVKKPKYGLGSRQQKKMMDEQYISW